MDLKKIELPIVNTYILPRVILLMQLQKPQGIPKIYTICISKPLLAQIPLKVIFYLTNINYKM